MQIDRALLRQSWRSWLSNDTHRVGPEWLQLVWTVGFAAAVALGFTLLGAALNRGPAWGDLGTWLRWYRVHFVISLAVALCIHALFAITIPLFGAARIQRFSGGQRALFFTAVPLVGVLIGWPLGVWLVSDTMGGWIRISAESATTSAVLALLISGIFFLFFNATARRMEAEKRATDAQLQLLQGQMEPHFLFNTLANVQSLMDHDLPRARQMLGDFTDHLRNSLGALRSDSSVVAQELALARSYLQLLQGRMEDRLHFEIDADEAALQQPLPPLLLQPLVENAVVHGLEPSIEGGLVQISARVHGQHLVLAVRDTGLGLHAPRRPGIRQTTHPRSGMALDNIRQRLLARWGGLARLEVTTAEPGTLARLTIPLDKAAR